jgi:putative membrane protein
MEKSNWYKIFLGLVLLIAFIWAAINPASRDVWWMENALIFLFVPLIILAGFYFRLSNLSYTLITIFLILHLIGSHYAYANVPFAANLSEFLGTTRNMYDRLVHLCFGLLIAYPLREAFMRVAKTKGFWGYYLPIELTLAFSVIYEFIEWGAIIFFGGSAGMDFVGAQGDIWDAHKDMFMAFIGSIIAMSITLIVNISINKNFWKEMKESFQLQKNDSPLGEEKIAKMLKSK